MRARRREINIFNMSLLDILCGALGAFCFMMLVALPYYIPPGSGLELRKAQDETDRLLLAISQMKDRLPDQKSVEEMEALMKQLEAQVKTLQGRVNIMTAENAELKARVKKLTDDYEKLLGEANELQADKLLLQTANQELKKKNDDLTAANQRATILLERRQSFIAAVHSTQFIDLTMIDEPNDDKVRGSSKDKVDDWLKGNQPRSSLHSFLSISGSSAEVRSATHPEIRQKVYVRISSAARGSNDADVEGALFTIGREERVIRIPKVTLSSERPWTLIGTVTFDQSYQPSFKEATAAERDEEWQAVTNSTPPPTPSPKATPDMAAANAAREKRQEVFKKFTRLNQLRPGVESDEAEILRLSDELIQALPPRDHMRREVESTRERTLAEKARREKSRAPSSPTPMPSPTP